MHGSEAWLVNATSQACVLNDVTPGTACIVRQTSMQGPQVAHLHRTEALKKRRGALRRARALGESHRKRAQPL